MSFEAVFPGIIDAEGPYSKEVGDSGGETCFGITRTYDADWDGFPVMEALQKAGVPHGEWKNNQELMDKVKAFYAKKAADISLDYLPEALHGILFGGCCNQGYARVIHWLQDALVELHQPVTADGHMGPATIGACGKVEAALLVDKLWRKRATAYLVTANHHKDQVQDFIGWMNRLQGGL